MSIRPPALLYKYVGSQPHHLDILRKLHIRFTQPDDLNDPYDCIPGVAPPVDVARFVDDTLTRNQAEIARRQYTATQLAAGRATMIAEYTNNPAALVKRCFEIVRRNLNELGILSLAYRNDNMVLWAHYADTHRGFVIGLRTDGAPLTKRPGEVPGEGELGPVDYIANRVIVPCGPLVLPPDLLFKKGLQWSYEEEWRIARRLSGCDVAVKDSASGKVRFHLCALDPGSVVRVDVGEQADKATVDAIKAATAPGTPLQHVDVYHARMDAGRTGFQFDRI